MWLLSCTTFLLVACWVLSDECEQCSHVNVLHRGPLCHYVSVSFTQFLSAIPSPASCMPCHSVVTAVLEACMMRTKSCFAHLHWTCRTELRRHSAVTFLTFCWLTRIPEDSRTLLERPFMFPGFIWQRMCFSSCFNT